MDPISSDALLAAGVTLIKPFVDKISKIKIDKAGKGNLDIEKALSINYQSYSAIKTLVYPNKPQPLNDIYVDLFIEESTNHTKLKIDHKADIFMKSRVAIIIDDAGMGKSTISKKIALNSISNTKYIPIFIELRSVNTKNNLQDKIKEVLGLPKPFDLSILDKNKIGNVAYIFDGFDEVELESQKDISKQISDFVRLNKQSYFLFTTRPNQYIPNLENSITYRVKPLIASQVYEILSKYDKCSAISISDSLIKCIKENADEKIKSFLNTPLYCALLYCSYRQKPIIPHRKHLFFEQVYMGLFENHDLSKENSFVRGKKSKLDCADFRNVLRQVAFRCLIDNFKIEYTKTDLLSYIKPSLESIPNAICSADDYFYDITNTVPLFTKISLSYSWSHKALLEFFIAEYICHNSKEKQKEILETLIAQNNIRFLNIIELIADIDYKTFRTVVVKPFCDNFFKDYETYSKKVVYKTITETMKKERFALLYGGEAFLYVTKDNSNREEMDKTLLRSMRTSKLTFNIGYRTVTKDSEIAYFSFFLSFIRTLYSCIAFYENIEIHCRRPTKAITIDKSLYGIPKNRDLWIKTDSWNNFENKNIFSIINDFLMQINTYISFEDMKRIYDNIIASEKSSDLSLKLLEHLKNSPGGLTNSTGGAIRDEA